MYEIDLLLAATINRLSDAVFPSKQGLLLSISYQVMLWVGKTKDAFPKFCYVNFKKAHEKRQDRQD